MSNEKLTPEEEHEFMSWERGKTRSKVAMGVLVVFFGSLFLLRELNVSIPSWLYHPSMILMAIGLLVLIRHKFKNLFGAILVLFGLMWSLKKYSDLDINLKLMFPLIAIALGLSMIFRPKGRASRDKRKWDKIRSHTNIMGMDEEVVSPEDFVDGVSIFGSIRKQITTKNFKGADILTLFGGTELNLIQASFESRAVVDLTTIFGGAEIIVPSDWQVKTEMVSIFGGTEDNRYNAVSGEKSDKVLILRGTCVFGGVEIKSYSV